MEEQALLSSLRNVPRAERHRLRELPDDQVFEDWKLGNAEESVLQARTALERFLSEKDELRAWEDAAYQRVQEAEEQLLTQAYTDACLHWYDQWREFHPKETG